MLSPLCAMIEIQREPQRSQSVWHSSALWLQRGVHETSWGQSRKRAAVEQRQLEWFCTGLSYWAVSPRWSLRAELDSVCHYLHCLKQASWTSSHSATQWVSYSPLRACVSEASQHPGRITSREHKNPDLSIIDRAKPLPQPAQIPPPDQLPWCLWSLSLLRDLLFAYQTDRSIDGTTTQDFSHPLDSPGTYARRTSASATSSKKSGRALVSGVNSCFRGDDSGPQEQRCSSSTLRSASLFSGHPPLSGG